MLLYSSIINKMPRSSVLGIIAIQGMMTGAILGGSSVQQAARLQMIIIFMISSSTALACIVTTNLALGIVVDSEHRVRTDRIDTRPHAVWRARDWVIHKACLLGKRGWTKVRKTWKKQDMREKEQEMEILLGSD